MRENLSPSKLGIIPNLGRYITALWTDLCTSNGVEACISDDHSSDIYVGVRTLTYLGFTECQVRSKLNIADPYSSVVKVYRDLYSGKCGELSANLYTEEHHTEMGRGRYFSMIANNIQPEYPPAPEERNIPLALGYTDEVLVEPKYPMALLFRYYLWVSADQNSYENTPTYPKYIIGGLKYLVTTYGTIYTLKLMDKCIHSANSPLDIKKVHSG